MPFDTTGTYTPPTGAENATPGQIIRSALWNSIFTDMATALTQLGEQSWVATARTITSAGNFTVLATDANILVNVPAGTITLPLSSTKQGQVRIFGNASTIFSGTSALVVATPADTINGVGTVTLTTAFQVATFFPKSSGGYIKY